MSYLQNELASELQNDSWNDLPSAIARDGSISVRHSASRYGADAARDDDNREAGGGEVGSGVRTFALSNAKSDEQSTNRSFQASDERSDALSHVMSDERSDVMSNEMSDGRSDEVSLRVSFLRCFPANSETSFQTRLQGSLRLSIVECRLRTRSLLNVGATPSFAIRGCSPPPSVLLTSTI